MELVFATHNQNKLEEVQDLMPQGIRLLGLDAIGCTEEIPETAQTLEGNALIKARFVRNTYGYDCFADDTGLEVGALGGEPGVYSARYAGEAKDARSNMKKLLEKMEQQAERHARFRTVIALVTGQGETILEGVCNGQITRMPAGEQGFGYDPVFQPEGFDRTFAQMSMAEKGRISHRGRAISKLIAHLSG